jgi:CRISPR-associated protein Csm3
MTTPYLKSKIIITGKVIAETGLMIGGSSSALEIGGTDKQIIRNPADKKPYIPGSSLKGKMRSLLEISRGTIGEKGSPTQNSKDEAARLFGNIKSKEDNTQQPSRLIVRDGSLTQRSADKLKDTELLYSEVKAENSISRITAEANPRFFERVPKSAEFDLNMILNVFDEKEGNAMLALVFECMRLVEDDYLGGGGSRGNGQIKFKLEKVSQRSVEYYKNFGTVEATPLTIPEDLR